MAEELEIPEPEQQTEDPFKKFGGQQVSAPKADPFAQFGGQEIKKKASGESSPTTSKPPTSTTAPIIFNSNIPSSLGDGKTALQKDLDFKFSISLGNQPRPDDKFSLKNISALNPDPGILNMPHEQQVESAKREIQNNPDLLQEYRQARIRDIQESKKAAEAKKSVNTAFIPMSDNQMGAVLDPVAVATANTEIEAANTYQVELQKSVEKAATIAVPKSFIDKGEPIDTKQVGRKYLEVIGDPTVGDETGILNDLANQIGNYKQQDIQKTQQGIEYKLDKNGSAVMSDFFLQQATDIAQAAPDKVQAYAIVKDRRNKATTKEEQQSLDNQLSIMLQDETVQSFQDQLNRSEEYAKKYEEAINQYPQVKRAELRQKLNDTFVEILQDDYGSWDILGGIFGRTPGSADIKEIAKRNNLPVEEVQKIVDEGGFFEDVPYTIRTNGFLQGIASGAKETFTESKMGIKRLLNTEDAAVENAVTRSRLDEYIMTGQKGKLIDDAGKWNINPYSIFNTMGHGIGQTTVFAAPTLLTGGLAAAGTIPARIIEASTTVASGYAGSYEGAYKEAARYTADEDIRRNYANITAFENAIPELLLSPAAIVKKIGGAISPRTSFESFAKDVAKDGLPKTMAQKYAAFGKEFGNVVLAENVEEMTTNVANNLTKERLLGVDMTAGDWLNQTIETAVQTTLATLPLGIGAGVSGLRDVSGIRKEALFESGNEPELYTTKLQDMFNKGLLSQDQLNQKIQVVNTMADIVAGVNKMEKPDGGQYTYEEKATIAAQQFRINNNNEIAKENPIDGVKSTVEADNAEAIAIQNNILNPPNTQNDENKIATEELANGGNNSTQAEANLRSQTVSGANAQSEQGELNVSQPGAAEVVAPVAEDNITIADVIDKPVTYNGQRARVYQDGQAVVVKIEGENKEYEIGNIDELSTQDISDFGITHEESVVSFDEAGDIVVRGKTYQNKYSDPLAAINRDEQGNVVSVNLDLPDGTKRTFRGNIAEDLAYNISLKEITKDNETRQQFEDFLNTDEVSVDLGSVPEITTEETTGGDIEIQRERVTPVVVDNPVVVSERDALIQQAVDRADEIQGIYGTAFKGNPEEALRQMAEQLHSPESELEARKSFGDAVSDIALKLFPKQTETPQSTNLVPDENTEAAKPEIPVTTEIGSTGTQTTDENQQRPATAPPTTGESASEEGDEEAPVGITQAAVVEMRKKLGLPPYDRTRVTDASLEALADQIITGGYDITKLIEKIEGGTQPNALETVILGKYKAVLDTTVENDPSDENIRLAQRFAEAVDRSGTEEGRSFRLRRFIPVGEQSLSDFFVREMDTEHVDTLTDAQKKTVTDEYNEINAAQDEAETATLKLQEAATEKKASDELEKVKKDEKTKQKKSHEEYVKDRERIANKIKDKLKKFRSGEEGLTAVPLPYVRELYAIAPDIGSYIKSLAEEGVTKLGDVTDAVFDILKDNIPEATKRDAHDLIAGIYNVNTKTKNELTQQVRDWREEAGLLNKLEGLLNGETPVNAIKNLQRNKEITELRNKIKQIQRTNTIVSQEENGFYTEEFLKDAVKVKQAAETYTRNAEVIEEEIRQGIFAPIEKKVPLTENDEFRKNFPDLYKKAVDAQDRLVKARKDREIRLAEIEYKNRTKWQKAWDILLAPIREVRSIKSSFDYSAPLRQGIIPTISEMLTDPVSAWNRMRRMVKSSADVKFFDRWMDNLRNTELWNVMQKSGLAIADPNSFGNKEEVFQSRFAQKIPGVKGSERAYAYYLNSQRVDMFAKGVEIMKDRGMTYENSKEEYKHWANTVNTLTGRGKLAKALENSSGPLSAIFFSPRLMAARLSMFNPFFYKNIPAPLRKMVAGDVARFVGLTASIVGAVALFAKGDDDDDWSTTLNPGSPDFGKLKKGNTRYDIFGGFLQYTRLISRPIGKLFGANTMKDNGLPDVLTTSMRSKLSPFPGSVWNVAAGKDLVGNKVTFASEAKQFLVPLVWKDTYEAIKDQGIQGLGTVTLPAALGVGVSTYDKNKKK